MLKNIYSTSLSLLMDQYQLTAAYVFWKHNLHETKSCFHLFHRKTPFEGGYAICAGLEYVVDWIDSFYFSESDIEFIASLQGNNGKKLFEPEFINWLKEFRFSCDVLAVPEGSVVFPHEPMLRVVGSIIDCLFIESFALATINSQTLFATLASRIVNAAKGAPVLDGGLRRAQGIDGALSASRAAYIGGIHGTSNMLAGKLFGIPTGGTMQHAFIMFFDSEIEAFRHYASSLPHNCVFLVDTYGTINGIKNAIEVSLELKKQGYDPIGIRLDSGDLAWLSKKGRKMLDEAGLTNLKIGGSNDLDEYLIQSMQYQEACIGTWIVGTKLLTSYNQPALGGVYKMSALETNNKWEDKIKLSEQSIKTSNPGILQVKRFIDNDKFCGDMIYDTKTTNLSNCIISSDDPSKKKKITSTNYDILLKPIIYNGVKINNNPTLNDIRQNCQSQLSKLDDTIKRFDNPHEYPVGLEENLYYKKTSLINKHKNNN